MDLGLMRRLRARPLRRSDRAGPVWSSGRSGSARPAAIPCSRRTLRIIRRDGTPGTDPFDVDRRFAQQDRARGPTADLRSPAGPMTRNTTRRFPSLPSWAAFSSPSASQKAKETRSGGSFICRPHRQKTSSSQVAWSSVNCASDGVRQDRGGQSEEATRDHRQAAGAGMRRGVSEVAGVAPLGGPRAKSGLSCP